MAVDYANLDRRSFEAMTQRETVRNVPVPRYNGGTDSLTKKQLVTLAMIYHSGTSGYGQIRAYPSRSGRGMPTYSVPETLDEKGFVTVKDKKQVSRRTGRGPNGFEKKKEGGYVNAYRSDDLLDEIAQKLGFSGRSDNGFKEYMKSTADRLF